MGKMNLGNTIEEKRATFEFLTKNSKKWGKVFAILGVLFGLFIGSLLLTGTDSILGGLLLGAIMVVAVPISYYWYGKIVYYGYLTIKVFFHERNIGAGAVAGAVGTSALVSYALGGKKAVKKVGVAWLVILMIALTIGILAGFYYYIKFHMEAKKLGFANTGKAQA